MNGWIGKILRVDLTTTKVSTEDLNSKFAADYLGGRGLGVKYFFDEGDPR